jgi:hypothetical protein
MDDAAGSQERVVIGCPYEIDTFGEVTPEQKKAFPEFFKIAICGSIRRRLRPDGSEELVSASPTSPEVIQGLQDLKQRDPDAERFVEYVNNTTEGCVFFGKDETDASEQRIEERARFCERIRKLADQFLTGDKSYGLLVQASEEYGRFHARITAIEEASRVVTVVVDADGFAIDITYQAAEVGLTEAQQRLLIDVARALTVVSVVIARDRHGGGLFAGGHSWLRPSSQNKSAPAVAPRDPRRKKDHYIRRLALIAQSGVNKKDKDAGYARLAFDAFKDEFVAMEADAVKNQYVRVLGYRALIIAVGFAIGWAACVTFLSHLSIAASIAPFLLIAVGACGGTWLSFAIRRVILGFNDLALLEQDRLAPLSRILFVIGLTWLVGMFLESGVVNADINGVRMDIGSSEIVTLLIGAMCGISERALAGAVGTRSEDFIKRVGTIPQSNTALPGPNA